MMKITHTEIYRFSIPMEPFVIATGTMDYAQNVLIKIYTDEGFCGIGECSAFPMIVGETQDTCLVLAKDFAKVWKEKDPLDIPERMKELNDYVAHNFTIKSAFDMALYDIASKAVNKPLYKFLNGEKRTVESDITIGIGKPDDMAAAAIQFKKAGATMLKVKLGKDIKTDLERMQKISSAVGTEMILRIDANQGWSFEDAAQILQDMKDLNIQFCEQPMRKSYDDRLAELRKISPIKIMADESCFDHHDARKLIKANACDYINIKFAKSGGILEALKIYETATAAGIACMIGGMLESRVALSAKLHFAYACPEIRFFDLDTCKIGHLEDPVIGGAEYKGFFLDLPDVPGIGADVDEAFLRKYERFMV